MHAIRAFSWKRLSSIGWDGLATFALSMVVITATGGLTFLVCWTIVIKFARMPAATMPQADVILVMGARLDRGKATRDISRYSPMNVIASQISCGENVEKSN